MKTALDVFFFEIPCYLHCLFNSARQLTQQDYQTNWNKIKDTNKLVMSLSKAQLHGGLSGAPDVLEALSQHLPASGFSLTNRTAESCQFGAMTINNLPILIDASYDSFQEQLNITYKFAVAPLQGLTTDCIRFVLTRQTPS